MAMHFTADPHFWHSNILKFSNRPFSTVEEMNEELIQRHNRAVKPRDTVYMLGDLCWRPKEIGNILSRLNGKIHYIIGNHDEKVTKLIRKCDNVLSVQHYLDIKHDGQHIILCHYPFASWNRASYRSWHLHGHCHTKYAPATGTILDVGIDNHVELRPFSYDEVEHYMEGRETNRLDNYRGDKPPLTQEAD